jgi:ammonia channel protein AmtB
VYLWPRRSAGKHQDAPVTLLDPMMVELGWLCFNLAMAADRGQTCGGF